RPVVSASSRPTGYSRRALGTSATTVGRPWGSRAVETTPRGLWTAYTARWPFDTRTCRPSTATGMLPSTSRAGSRTTSSPTVTRPANTSCSEARREATPAWARYLASRTAATIGAVDLALLDETLAGEPAFRARQVWSWAARGAAGYDEMTDLPAALRARLAADVPFSSLSVTSEARSADGTI